MQALSIYYFFLFLCPSPQGHYVSSRVLTGSFVKSPKNQWVLNNAGWKTQQGLSRNYEVPEEVCTVSSWVLLFHGFWWYWGLNLGPHTC
jgi:hypothetical protein